MTASTQLWLVVAGLLVIASAMASILAALLERSSTIRLSHWVEEAGGRLRALYDRPRRFEAFRFLLTVASFLLSAALAGWLVLAPWGAAGRGWGLGGLALLMALLELANRSLVGKDPEAVLSRLTRPYRLAALILAPALPLVAAVMPDTAVDFNEEDEDEASEQEIEAYINVGTREGILDDEGGILLRSVVDFGETRVRSVMTPRIDMLCAPASSTLAELVTVFVESTHSRLPLYEGSIDNIVGLLHIRDLLRVIKDGEDEAWRDQRLKAGSSESSSLKDRASEDSSTKNLAKEVWFVPESKPLSEVLKELQARRQQLAVVVDEYGGTSGLVTIEDLLEELVGDIVDQDEDLPPQMREAGEGRWRFDGRMRIDELARVFDLTLDDDSVDTVGGMVFSAFGYVPAKGEPVEIHGLRFTVEQVQDRRIKRVLVEVVPVSELEEVVDAG